MRIRLMCAKFVGGDYVYVGEFEETNMNQLEFLPFSHSGVGI